MKGRKKRIGELKRTPVEKRAEEKDNGVPLIPPLLPARDLLGGVERKKKKKNPRARGLFEGLPGSETKFHLLDDEGCRPEKATKSCQP